MRLFVNRMNVTAGTSILDIGGRPDLWKHVDDTIRITLLNLPQEIDRMKGGTDPRFDLIVGNACSFPHDIASYDVVFSNSVLEHVGSRRRQLQFAQTVQRGAAYWVQVPAPLFPLEVHCRVPFWWLLPSAARRRLIWKWFRAGKRFQARQMAGTRPIGRKRLRELFPEGRIETERWLGFPKSYYIFRQSRASSIGQSS